MIQENKTLLGEDVHESLIPLSRLKEMLPKLSKPYSGKEVYYRAYYSRNPMSLTPLFWLGALLGIIVALIIAYFSL